MDSTIFLVGREYSTGEYVENTDSCIMCKRMIINAGIKDIVIRDDKENYRQISVEKWIAEEKLPKELSKSINEEEGI